MTRSEYPGWFGEILPSGVWSVSGPDATVMSDGYELLNPGEAVMFTRMASFGSLRLPMIIGKGHRSGMAWLWDGFDWHNCGPTHGNSPCAWDYATRSALICRDGSSAYRVFEDGSPGGFVTLSCGSQGIRWIRDDSTIVTGDSSYADGRGLWEYTDFGDVSIGQCESGVGVRFASDGIVRVIEGGGDTQFVRVNRHGNNFGIAFRHVKTSVVVLLLVTAAELMALPPEKSPEPAKPEPVTPKPEEPIMQWKPEWAALLKRYVAVFALPTKNSGESQDAYEDRLRYYMLKLAQQFKSSTGLDWGRKRASESRPWAKDCLPLRVGSALHGWDIMGGAGTGNPELHADSPSYHDLVAEGNQVFEPVAAVNWLGMEAAPEPVTPPVEPQPEPPGPVVPPPGNAALEATVARLVAWTRGV